MAIVKATGQTVAILATCGEQSLICRSSATLSATIRVTVGAAYIVKPSGMSALYLAGMGKSGLERYRGSVYDGGFNTKSFNRKATGRRVSLYGGCEMSLESEATVKTRISLEGVSPLSIDCFVVPRSTCHAEAIGISFAMNGAAFSRKVSYEEHAQGFIRALNRSGFNRVSGGQRVSMYGASDVVFGVSAKATLVAKPHAEVKIALSTKIETLQVHRVSLAVHIGLGAECVGIIGRYGASEKRFLSPFNTGKFNVTRASGLKAFYGKTGFSFDADVTAAVVYKNTLEAAFTLASSGIFRTKGMSDPRDARLRLSSSALAFVAHYGHDVGFDIPFNRAKFNVRRYEDAVKLYGSTRLALGESGYCRAVIIAEGVADLRLSSEAHARYCALFPAEQADLRLHTSETRLVIGKRTALFEYLFLRILPVRLYTQKSEFMRLHGLALKPGDVLRIDTENCVATVNGQNVMEFLTDDSTFFYLLNGENAIICESGGENPMAETKVMWRNRYL